MQYRSIKRRSDYNVSFLIYIDTKLMFILTWWWQQLYHKPAIAFPKRGIFPCQLRPMLNQWHLVQLGSVPNKALRHDPAEEKYNKNPHMTMRSFIVLLRNLLYIVRLITCYILTSDDFIWSNEIIRTKWPIYVVIGHFVLIIQ